jgi:hypothetical protein
MEAITGRPEPRSASTSRRIASLATYDPPGLSTRSTTALTDSSRAAARSVAPSVSEPTLAPDIRNPLARPRWIGPEARTSATTGRRRCVTDFLTAARRPRP